VKPIPKKLINKTLTLCVFLLSLYCKADDVRLDAAIQELNAFIATNGLKVQKTEVSDWSRGENSGTKYLGLGRTDGQQLRITFSGYNRADGWRGDSTELLQTVNLKFIFPEPLDAANFSVASRIYSGSMTAPAREKMKELIEKYLILKLEAPHNERLTWPLIFSKIDSSIQIRVDMVHGNLAALNELFLELGKIVALFSENERNELVFDRIASAVKKLEGNCRAQVSFAREAGPFLQF
jgi:hypothetical protein